MPPIEQLTRSRQRLVLSEVADGFAPLLLADAARLAPGHCVYVAPDEAAMAGMAEALAFFAPELAVLQFPAWDCLPYDRSSPSLHASAARLATLAALDAPASARMCIVTTVAAITQRTLTPFRIRQLTSRLARGLRIDRDALTARLLANGYSRVDNVADAGEFAVRGSIVDLYPSGAAFGLRLDFFGDEIESIREFDPADQRSRGTIDGFTLLPAAETLLEAESIKRFRSRYREFFGATATGDPVYQAVSEGRRHAGMDHWLPLFEERLVPVSEHLGKDTLYIAAHGIEAAATARFDAIADYHANRVDQQRREPGSYRPLAPEALYLSPNEWNGLVTTLPVHGTTPHAVEPGATPVIALSTRAAHDFAADRAGQGPIYARISSFLCQRLNAGQQCIIACYSQGSRDRLCHLLSEHGAPPIIMCESWSQAQTIGIGEAAVAAITLPIEHGFQAGRLLLLSEQDMLGDRLVRRARKRKSADAFLNELASLDPGDLIVHRDHGIGRYEGLVSIPVGQSPHDCVALTYAGGDKLYVPVENLDILTRYGSESDAPLDRLGGEAWQRRRARMKERIREIAGELMAIAAARALKQAPVLMPDASYADFVSGFPWQETEDQERAIGDVLDDLASGRPMDRLVCGDVGFGKTEVALRAAYVAAMAGLQVAVLCPTTLLARQHAATFADRFRHTPLKIGKLSRLVGAKETAQTRAALADGTLDIVVGTHALLAKGISFQRLGLVIVDEEQRFGVTHKERMKALKADVHVLTLSATPIPRTLQMAMSGLRDLSVIQTPPVDRLAVRTYIMEWDAIVLREALLREHYRGGQSFFVVPHISDLPDIEEFLRRDVPEIRFVSAHGQMASGEIEARMSAFYDRQYDVLLSTTIVESGLDIPTANTMIVHHANRFGLAQLYQLRGRVGRSKTRAYAYFSTAASRVLTENADKRLKILSNLDSLGAGFQLASHDLDIRGAGNLLGDEQSGHIREVGFELYQSMLEEAILAAKAGDLANAEPRHALSPQITIDVPILIPDDYVPDLSLRMGLYRRLNALELPEEIEAFGVELVDRFGALPPPAANLLILIQIRINAQKAGIARMDVGSKGALVTFHENRFANVDGLIDYVARLKGSARIRPDNKLSISRDWSRPDAQLNGALQLSRGLAKLAQR